MSNPESLHAEIIEYLESNQLDSAEVALSRLKEMEPNSQRFCVLQAALWEKQGQMRRALELLERRVRSSLDSGVARTNLARLYWKLDERDKALSVLRFGLTQEPNQERALHFYAALTEQSSGLEAALSALAVLAEGRGAWLPAWVGAMLATQHGAKEQIGPLLHLAAQRAQSPFPPESDTDGFRRMLQSLPSHARRSTATQLRPYCRIEAQSLIDEFLQSCSSGSRLAGEVVETAFIGRSVWRHFGSKSQEFQLGVAPVVLLEPENWGMAELAGRLGRGLALLLTELLDSLGGVSAAVHLGYQAGVGLLNPSRPYSAEELCRRNASRARLLLGVYLTHKSHGEFVLDAELYSDCGQYLERESCRGSHPGTCLELLAKRLQARLGPAEGLAGAPKPDLDVQDALARDAVATFVLCADGNLGQETIANSGLLLDALVDYAVERGESSSLLTLWAGVEAARAAKVPSAEQHKELLDDLLGPASALSPWIGEDGPALP